MNSWNEGNFLERLMPPLKQKISVGDDPCPDAETLCAVIERKETA
jgi:hypothetical protein